MANSSAMRSVLSDLEDVRMQVGHADQRAVAERCSGCCSMGSGSCIPRRRTSFGVAVTVLPSTDLFVLARHADHKVPRCVTSCSTISTRNWLAEVSASAAMPMTATSTFESPRRRTGHGLREPVPDRQAQAEGKRGEERGGATRGAVVLGI